MDLEKIKHEAFTKTSSLDAIRYIYIETGLGIVQSKALFDEWKNEGMRLPDVLSTEQVLAKENIALKAENERLSRLNKELIEALNDADEYFNKKPWTSKGKLAKRVGEKIHTTLLNTKNKQQ